MELKTKKLKDKYVLELNMTLLALAVVITSQYTCLYYAPENSHNSFFFLLLF